MFMVKGHSDERLQVMTVFFTAVIHSSGEDQDYYRHSVGRLMSQDIKGICSVDLAYFLMEEHFHHTAG